ncbi:unnamed protein product [Allacma fusca]|uniref:cardiolipin synthase (CMP-forming) n=1 Tax=Allacma fusca TaxID=39272 RepID=A0A8J2L9W6_9HEXA|nr:unnamed protein product [Allacma fusca]
MLIITKVQTRMTPANCYRRLSAIRAQIQRQSRSYEDGLPFFPQTTLKKRLAQWPLGLSYYNKITALSSAHVGGFAIPSGPVQFPREDVSFLYSHNKDVEGESSLEKQRERFQTANRRLREKKENIMKEIQETKEHMRQKMDKIITKENIYTVPNLLCVLRIASSPVLVYLIMNQQYGSAVGIFAFAGVTDLLDGYIARVVPGQSSALGSFLDPMADKILVATLFLSLTYVNLIPLSLTALIVARDSVLIAAASHIRYKSLEPPVTLSKYFDVSHPSAQLAPTFISKVNTGIQLGLVGATLVSTILPFDISVFLTGLCWCTAATTIGSGLSYVFARNTFKLVRTPPGKEDERKP